MMSLEGADGKYQFDTSPGTHTCTRRKTIANQFHESACSGRTDHLPKNL